MMFETARCILRPWQDADADFSQANKINSGNDARCKEKSYPMKGQKR